MKILLWLETLMALLLAVVYWIRPDYLAALTIFPAGIWLLLVLPLLPFLRRRHLRLSSLFFSAWVFFVIVHVEESHSLVRGLIRPLSKVKPAGAIRLVTVNCGGGQPSVLDELKTLDADIIFLQESPLETDIKKSAHELFGADGDYIYDFDTSILARGKMLRQGHGYPRVFYTSATVTLPGLAPIDVLTLHLAPTPARFDLWNPTCWKIQRGHRQLLTRQLRQIVTALPHSKSLIVAGDFNAPQGDKIFSNLPATLYDTFAASGKGLGNTLLNDIPVLRIDQIWVSPEFITIQSFARKTGASDHRMVISDIRKK